MNKNLLFRLYEIHSPSGCEKKMRRFLKREIVACGATFEQDVYGNLLVTKGVSDTYPCLASHIDQVQKNHSKDFKVVDGGSMCCGFSMKTRQFQGLGADDKNGIFICLECLRIYDVLKVAFFVGEEIGCVGSSQVDLEFFSDCRFIIEPDRRGGNDLITSMFCGDVCSKDFIDAIGADAFGYKEAEGTITDVGELAERGVGISCINLSCGYYDAHTDREYTVFSELENCLELVCYIIKNCTDVYPYEYEYVMSKYDTTYYGSYDSDWDTMSSILDTNPSVTFDEVFRYWSYGFICKDRKYLEGIYSDVRFYMGDDVKWWEKDFDDDDSIYKVI